MSTQNSPVTADFAEELRHGERRAWVRYPSRLHSTCHRHPGGDQESWPARIQNVSVAGLGLVMDRCFTAGTVLAVDIIDAEGKQSQTILARVEHTKLQGEGNWLLGCSIVE
jgi:hypothetical protein